MAPQPATTPVLVERLRLRSSPSPRQIGLKYFLDYCLFNHEICADLKTGSLETAQSKVMVGGRLVGVEDKDERD